MIYNKYLPLTFSLLFLVKYFICLQNSIAGIFGTTTTAATEFMVCRQRSLPRQSKSGRGDQCRGQVHSGQDPGYGCGLMAVIAQVLAVMAKIIAKVFKALAERTKVVAWSVRKTLLGRNKSNRGAKGMNYSHSNNPPRVEQQGRRKWRKFMPDRRCRSNGRKFMPGPSAEEIETITDILRRGGRDSNVRKGGARRSSMKDDKTNNSRCTHLSLFYTRR